MKLPDVSQPVMITLDEAAPRFVATAFARLPGVNVISGAPSSSVVRADGVEPLRIDIRAIGELRDELNARSAPTGSGLRVVAVTGVVDAETASQLEDLGVGFADADGTAWLPGQRRTSRARTRRDHAPQRLRPESLRLAQLLVDHPLAHWTERSLAARGDSTQVTAHRLLRRLEDAGLVSRDGAGPDTSRHVADSRALRTWLLEHGRPGRIVRLRSFVRRPEQIPAALDDLRLALTGAHAAERIGVPVLTGTPPWTYRVDCGPERLEDVPAILGGFRTDQAANVILISDPGRLGHVDARTTTDGSLVAPPSRIMLDLLLETRGQAAAEVFSDLWPEQR